MATPSQEHCDPHASIALLDQLAEQFVEVLSYFELRACQNGGFMQSDTRQPQNGGRYGWLLTNTKILGMLGKYAHCSEVT